MKEKGGGESRAAQRREKTRGEAEDEAAETEGDDGKEGFDPTVGLRGVVGSGTTKAEENCVALGMLVRS